MRNTSNFAGRADETTRKEILYLAQAYYDCAQFVFNSGFRDMGLVNSQFSSMISNYVNAGKIKRDSYKKFQEVSLGIDITTYPNKAGYVAAIASAVDNRLKFGAGANVDSLFKDFQGLLRKYGLSLGDKKEKVLFLDLLNNLVDATNSSILTDMFEAKKTEWRMDSVSFNEPRVRTSDGDGCGHGIAYGSAFRNWDKYGI